MSGSAPARGGGPEQVEQDQEEEEEEEESGESSSGPGVPPPAFIALPCKYTMQKNKISFGVDLHIHTMYVREASRLRELLGP